MENEQIYMIALSLIPKCSIVEKKKLLEDAPSIQNLFDRHYLDTIPDLNPELKIQLTNGAYLEEAATMQEHSSKQKYTLLTIHEPEYPYRLKECPDSPLLLFQKGSCSMNDSRIVSIVGTRQATPYGRDLTRALVRDLATIDSNIIVVSGLAYGIDVIAHQAALEFGLRTACVLAHGLHMVYPTSHYRIAGQMIEHGGANFTELPWGTPAEEYRFLQRNRIVAGMCDACVVVESGIKGGSMKTAKCAQEYNKDVFAFPGRTYDKYSNGCNNLIYENVAGLIESGEDLMKKMGWIKAKTAKQSKRKRFVNLEVHQQALFDCMEPSSSVSVQLLAQTCGWSIQQTLAVLMELELEGLIERRPGGEYRLFLDS